MGDKRPHSLGEGTVCWCGSAHSWELAKLGFCGCSQKSCDRVHGEKVSSNFRKSVKKLADKSKTIPDSTRKMSGVPAAITVGKGKKRVKSFSIFCRGIGCKGTTVEFRRIGNSDRIEAIWSDSVIPISEHDPETLAAHDGHNVTIESAEEMKKALGL